MMPHNDQECRLRALFGELTSRETSSIALDDDLAEALSLDSLAALRMLAAIEKRFGVRFPDEQLTELRTLRQLLVAIEQAQHKENPG